MTGHHAVNVPENFPVDLSLTISVCTYKNTYNQDSFFMGSFFFNLFSLSGVQCLPCFSDA